MAEDSDKEKSATEQLYENALALERQIAAAGYKHALWQPPSEQEFNDQWITRFDALDVSDERLADDADKWDILERLRAGAMTAVARTGQVNPTVAAVQPFVHVPAGAWSRMDKSAEFFFWRTGNLVVPVAPSNNWGGPTEGNVRYFDIRFHPDSFSGRPPPRVPDEPSMHPRATDAPKLAEARPSKLRGAPRKGWWEDLLIEVIRRVRAGELHAESKTELQQILEDYVDEIGGKYGDSTLKPLASKLFDYLEEIRGK